MSVGDEGQDAPEHALLAPLQWMAMGLLLAVGVTSIEYDGWTLRPVGFLILAWAAHTARTASVARAGRAAWAGAIGTCIAVALKSVTFREPGPGALTGVVLYVVALNLIVWALAATTHEYGLAAARRWTALAWFLGAASILGSASAILAWNVGTEQPLGVSGGSYLNLGGTRLSLPEWAWPPVVAGMLPALAALVWGTVLFVSTYREVKRSRSGWGLANPHDPGVPLPGDGY